MGENRQIHAKMPDSKRILWREVIFFVHSAPAWGNNADNIGHSYFSVATRIRTKSAALKRGKIPKKSASGGFNTDNQNG